MKKYIIMLIKVLRNWYAYWAKFLTIIGDIKVFKTPCYLIYDPSEFDYCIRGNAIRQIEQIIQPGDIILRKYIHYLDNYLIPGEYSHSGIYIGNNKVVHAIAEGVKEIDIIDFCQTDKICVLRGKDLANTTKIVEKAQKFIGTEYDFLFNSQDDKNVYCHELTARCLESAGYKIQKYPATFLGIKFKLLKNNYLADSFLQNDSFEKIIEL